LARERQEPAGVKFSHDGSDLRNKSSQVRLGMSVAREAVLHSKRHLISFGGRILVIAAMLAIGCGSADVQGTYQSVSESEWNLTVELRPDNVAIITLENWFPGEYDSRNVETTTGTWVKYGDLILLKYDQTVDTLVFDPHLSLEELGLEGGAPGLHQRTSFAPTSLVHDIKLWKLPHDPISSELP